MRYAILLILFSVMISCCVENKVSKELIINMDANPDRIFTNGKTILTMDITNEGNKTIRNLYLDVFDTGFLTGKECKKSVAELGPDRFETLSCKLFAPPTIPSPTFENIIEARVKYQDTFSVSKLIKVISREEYDLEMKTGRLELEPKTYSFSDNNIELTIDFSKEIPFVEDRKENVYFTIRNIGNGFIDSLKPDDIRIESEIVKCPPQVELLPLGKTFPRIACEIYVPKNINYLSEYMLIININYDYEIRDSVVVEIVR